MAERYPLVSVSLEHYTGSLELSSSLLLAHYLRPPSNLLLRILPFFFFFFDRTLAANVSLCRCTGALSPSRTEKDPCGWKMCRANWQSQRVRYFLGPTKLRWSRKENLREGTLIPLVDLHVLANAIDGAPNGQLPCILDRQRLPQGIDTLC